MPDHYPLSASAAARWMACPGSVALSARFPDSKNEDAARGTAAHLTAARCLRESIDPALLLGQGVGVEGQVFDIDEDMVEQIQQYIDAVQATVTRLPGSVLEVEKQFCLDWINPRLGGTADAIIRQDFGELVVRDFKSGRSPVIPEANPQVMIYGLGAMGPDGDGYDHVTLAIDQPHQSSEPLEWSIARTDLLEWGEKVLKPAAERALSPGAPLIPGDVQCEYCRAAGVCPKVRVKAAELIGAPGDPIDAGYQIQAHDLDVGQLKRLLQFTNALDGLVKAAKTRAREMLEQGLASPQELGQKLVAVQTHRKWKDPDVAAMALSVLGDEVWKKKLESPSGVEKILKKKGVSSDMLEPLVEKPFRTTMAPLTDKRPAIQPAIAAFSSIPTQE